MRSTTWLSWLTLLSLMLLALLTGGCQKGRTPMPPVITSIAPTGVLGVPDQPVTFSAQVTGAGPFTYAWTFGGGTDPATSTAESPTVDLGEVGTYTGTLTVTDALSESTMAPFVFEVQPLPTIQGITPDGPVGRPLQRVTFAADTTGYVAAYAWDFGGGALPNSSTDATPEVAIQAPGTYTGSLTVFANGAAIQAVPFEYEVEVATAPTFSLTRVGPASSGAPGRSPVISMVNHWGRLAMVYNPPTGGLMMARAKTTVPSGCCDWEQYPVVPVGGILSSQSLVSINGRLALLYGTAPESGAAYLWVAIATTEEPTSSDDWIRYKLTESEARVPYAMITVGERLRVFHCRNVLLDPLIAMTIICQTATVELPTSASDWSETIATDDFNGIIETLKVAQIGDTVQALFKRPTEVGGGIVPLLQASSLDPAGPEDWRIVSASADGSQVSRGFDLIDDGGVPFLAFPRSALTPFPRNMLLLRPTVPEPRERGHAEDWQVLQLTGQTADNIGPVSLARSLGRLAVVFQDRKAGTTLLGRQIGVNNMATADWEIVTIDGGQTDRWTGLTALTDLDGRLAVAYSLTSEGQIGIAVANDEY
ncbi:MAG: hypothetical protein GEEBNDBF_02173 [bacterium]|nr:hypothetical protein [bacterium]